jgi:hypothetical protein
LKAYQTQLIEAFASSFEPHTTWPKVDCNISRNPESGEIEATTSVNGSPPKLEIQIKPDALPQLSTTFLPETKSEKPYYASYLFDFDKVLALLKPKAKRDYSFGDHMLARMHHAYRFSYVFDILEDEHLNNFKPEYSVRITSEELLHDYMVVAQNKVGPNKWFGLYYTMKFMAVGCFVNDKLTGYGVIDNGTDHQLTEQFSANHKFKYAVYLPTHEAGPHYAFVRTNIPAWVPDPLTTDLFEISSFQNGKTLF